MFGLENQKKKTENKPDSFEFDLEKGWHDPASNRKMKQTIEERIQRIKAILKAGESREEFDKFGILLHGYTALLKVMSRCLVVK